MTTAVQLIAQLGSAGIQLHLDEQQQLRFRAPKGAMTAQFKQAISDNKADIIAFLQQTQYGHSAISRIERVENQLYALSESQQRFYFLDQLQQGDIALNIPAVLSIQGPLEKTVLDQAWQALVMRQEALRTVFVLDEQQNVAQKILPHPPQAIEWQDESQQPDTFSLQDLAAEFAQWRFDLTQCAYRLRLVKTAAQQHYLLLTLHHMISDGWSIPILVQELGYFYQCFLHQQAPALPALPIQYLDYSQHQIQQSQMPYIQQQLQYWQRQLDGMENLDLPLDNTRPRQHQSRGASLSLSLDNTVLKRLEALAIEQNSSLFNVLLSAFATLLYRYTGQHDMGIGTPSLGRKQTILESIIGCFIGLLTVRCQPRPELRFIDLLKHNTQTVLAAYDHQDIAFEQVAKACSAQRNTAIAPLFQVLFTYQSALNKQWTLGDLHLSLMDQPSYSAKYDLQLHIEQGEQSQLIIEYNRDIFVENTISLMAQCYQTLLESISQNAEQTLAQLPLFNSALQQALLPHSTIVPMAEDLNVLLPKPSARIVQGAQSYSSQQLQDKANRIAHWLKAQGFEHNSRIGLLLDYGVDFMAAMLACIQQGYCYVPMDSRYPKERLNLMAETGQLACIISHSAIANRPDGLSLLIDTTPLDNSATLAPCAINQQAALYLIFTSGSTGTPKAASVSRANEVNLLHWYLRHYAFNASDKWLVFSALGFDLTQKNLLAPLACGAQLVFPDSPQYDPEALLNIIESQQISVINCAPSAFYPIVDLAAGQQRLSALSSLRYVLFGGEPIMLDNLRRWLDDASCHAQLDNMYGPTECTDITCTWPIDTQQRHATPIGKTIDHVNAYVLDEQMNAVPVGAMGELYIAGNSVGLGYINQPHDARFMDNPFGQGKLYRTGDKVRYLPRYWPEKVLSFIARNDDQIKIRGFRIELGEIASQLSQLDGIKEAKVVVDKDQQHLLAYYIAAQNALDNKAIRAALQQVLPSHMLPSAFIAIEQWPLSANGKIDIKRLPKPQASDYIQQPFEAPSSLLQQQLCALLEKSLGIETIGINDDFFELGGHSLLAAQWINQLNQRFHCQLSLADFFQQATIKALAEKIEQGTPFNNVPSLEQYHADRSQPIALSWAQQRLWIIEQLNPNSAVYNIPLALTLTGQLNQAALLEAINLILERHESLRTRMDCDSQGQAYQHILPVEACPIEQQSLEANANLTQIVNDFAQQPFDLQNDSLCRIRLLHLDDNQHVLMLCLHHIISDGWSLGILQQELSQAYNALSQGQAVQLPPLPVQYADFSQWQRLYLDQNQQQQHLAYWLQQLDNIPSAIQLPFDKPRGAQQSMNGAVLKRLLPSATYQSIKAISQQQAQSVFTSLVSIYAVLLNKLSNQPTVCIGTPVAGRPFDCLQPLIGYFINALVLRCDFDATQTLKDFSQQLKHTVIDAFGHDAVPIEQLLEHLNLERTMSHAPVAQVGFSFIHQQLAQLPELKGLQVSTIDDDKVLAKYELTLIAIEHNDGLELHFEYNRDLFKASTIERFAEHFIHLCQAFIEKNDAPLASLSLFQPPQIAQLCQLDSQTIEAIYPLSAMQKDLVFSQQLKPDTLANTLGYAAELEAWVDDALWQQACQIVCQQQPITRTRFAMNPLAYGELAWQYTLKQLDIELQVLDYRGETLSREQIQARIDAFIYQPLAYQQGQLIRYGLMRLGDQHSILLLSSHHALLDGVSIVLIAQQALRAYERLIENPMPSIDIEPFFMADYVRKDQYRRDSLDTQSFWQQQFQSCQALDFPARLCSNIKQQRIRSLNLPEPLYHDMRRYCKSQRITPATLFSLLYGLLISDYCRADKDFYFHQFNTGRDSSNYEALGCFFEQSAFIFPVSQINKNSSINDLIRYLHHYHKTIKPFNHLSLSGCHALSPQGRLQFMYNYYHFYPLNQELDGAPILCMEKPPYLDNTVQFIVKQLEHTLQLDLYYQSQCFNDRQFLQRMTSLLEQIVSGTQRLADLSLLLADDASISQGQTLALPASITSISQLFESRVKQTPEAIALIDDQQTLTYQALNDYANQLADYLSRQGIHAGQRIGLLMGQNHHAIAAIWAVIKLGACYVPIDKHYPAQRIEQILQQGQIALLLSDETRDPALNIRQLDLSDCSADNPNNTHSLDDALYIIFTSGSTGAPKGAAVKQRGEVNLLQWYCREHQFNEASRVLIISALGFDLTQKNLFAPLITGGQLVLHDSAHYDSDAIAALIEQHHISHINCAPSAFYPLLEKSRYVLNSLKQVMLGGETIATTRLANAPAHCSISNHYGPTECTDIALFYRLQSEQSAPVPLGSACDNVTVFLVNRFGQLMPQGLLGEIAISGAGLGLGYINDEAAQQKKFVRLNQQAAYLTGDLAYQQDDGLLQFIGRSDFQVKLRGLRIELGEIESVLKTLTAVDDAQVLVKNEQLIAYLLSSQTLDEAAIKQTLAGQLPRYMLPAHIITLTQWPLNAHGKVDIKQLPEPSAQSQAIYLAPRDEVEKTICAILEQILPVEKVGVLDNFFDLGGHSLAASRAIVQIREQFQVELPLSALFEMTTVEKLANYIKASQWLLQSAEQHKEDENRDTGFI